MGMKYEITVMLTDGEFDDAEERVDEFLQKAFASFMNEHPDCEFTGPWVLTSDGYHPDEHNWQGFPIGRKDMSTLCFDFYREYNYIKNEDKRHNTLLGLR